MSRERVLAVAKQELGTAESPARSNRTKYGVWYGLDGQAWCAIFVSWVFNEAKVPLGSVQSPKGIQHCQGAYGYYKNKNLVVSEPQPGDIVLYDWKGDGWADHIGIFIRWTNQEKTRFKAYEGNTSLGNDSDGGMVMERDRSKNSVKAFVNPGVYPQQSVQEQSQLLQIGDRGAKVAQLQKNLYELGYAISVDGWFGKQTESVIKEFQAKYIMAETGQCDPVTLGAIFQVVQERKIAKSKLTSGIYLMKGNAGIGVMLVQEALNKWKAGTINNVNGVFDQLLCEAVKAFQKANNLESDGIVGPLTAKALDIR